MWNGAMLIWSLAIATWFPAVSFVKFLAPIFGTLWLRIEVCIFLTSGWGSLVKGCGRFAGNFQQLITLKLRYHQVTAHPGRSINVHVWHGTQTTLLYLAIYISSLNLTAISHWKLLIGVDEFFLLGFDGLCFFLAVSFRVQLLSIRMINFKQITEVLASCQVWCCQLQGSKGAFLKAGGWLVGWLIGGGSSACGGENFDEPLF